MATLRINGSRQHDGSHSRIIGEQKKYLTTKKAMAMVLPYNEEQTVSAKGRLKPFSIDKFD